LEHSKPNWKPRTYEGNESMSRLHIVPALGSVKLADLSGHRVQVWIRTLGRRRLAGHCRTTLRAACELAIRWGWLVRNPVDLTSVQPTIKREHPEVSIEQARAILAAVQGSVDYPVVCLLLGCGLRISEALGIRWQDWDSVAGVIHVAGQLSSTGTHEPTKTRSGNRLVSVPSWVRAALDGLERAESAKPTEFVFGGRTRGAVRISVSKKLKAAGISGVRLHDMRHAYASLLIDAGVPITGVSAALGHASPAITMSVYAHKLAGVDTRTSAALEGLVEEQG
jgi:integrase